MSKFGLNVLALIVLAFSVSTTTWAQGSAEPSLVIEGGTLIDGTGAAPRPSKAIVIAGNRIKEILPADSRAPVPAASRVIRAEGMTIVPGLIDSHVHLRGFDGELYLSNGITSVLDLSNILDWILAQKEGIAKGKILGPRIYSAGAAINSMPLFSWHMQIKDAEEGMRATTKLAELGVDLIKVHAGITPSQLQGVVRQAHRSGLNVIGHLGHTDAREAAEAGIDALAHMSGVLMALAPSAVAEKWRSSGDLDAMGTAMDFDVDNNQAEALARLLVAKHVRMEPDLVLRAKGVARQWPQFQYEIFQLLQDPNLRYIWPSARERWLNVTPMNDFSAGSNIDYVKLLSPEETAKRLAAHTKSYQFHIQFLKKFLALGGEVIVGTDVQHFGIPGLTLHQEMQLLVEDAGMKPMDVLVGATRNPARFVHQEKNLGTLEAGKLADLLLVRGDPLQDIRKLRDIATVVQDGKIVETGYRAWYQNPIPRPSQETGGINPTPLIAALDPDIATEGDREVVLRIKGTRFVPGCVVSFNGRSIPLVSGSRTELTVKLRNSDTAQAGTYPIVVTNPSPEGGPSEPVYFMVKFR